MPTMPPAYREAPPIRPRPFGLFSVAPPTLRSDGGWKAGVEWESSACGLNVGYADAFCAPTGTNEVQTATITGTPTGGTFRLTYLGQTTGTIPYNANAATVQAALLALDIFETGDIVVTGGPGPGTPFTFTFGGAYLSTNVDQITATGSFTGGTAPAITTATTTPGVRTAKLLTEDDEATGTAGPFNVYIVRECRAVGDSNRAKAKAQEMLTNAEERGAEKEVWTRIVAAATTAGTNLTPGTLVSPEHSLAILEEWMKERYDGAPVIHVSSDLGSILATKGAIERHGTHMETKTGSWVVVGAGYPRTGIGGAPAAGTEWMFATGGVFVDRGQSFVQGPYMVQTPLDNTQIVLAERTYVVGWDCTPAGIRANFP